MHTVVQMNRGDSSGARYQQNVDNKAILGLLNSYWGSTEYEFTIQSQS